jgi:hypothetical protein
MRSFFGQQASLKLLQGGVNEIARRAARHGARTFTLAVKCSIKFAEP